MSERARPIRRPVVGAIATIAVVGVSLVGVTLGSPPQTAPWLGGAVLLAVSVTFVWALLSTRRHRRIYEARLTAWTAHEAVHAERLRIARDLHDLVSHALALITVRAAGTRRIPDTIDGDTERSVALADIEDASRQATTELRRMLSLLRDDTTAPAPRQPASGMKDLPALIEDFTRLGLNVELHTGDLKHVTPGVQLAVYTIAQEALVNTLRHAGLAHVTIRVEREGSTVVVIVRDNGPTDSWTARPGAGHGLLGLDERVQHLGGTFLAEATGTGFCVTARLPDSVTA